MELRNFTDIISEYSPSTIVLSFLTIITTLLYFKRSKNLPPGPWGLPIVGYLPFMKKTPHLGITDLGKKYGSVMSFYLGSALIIMLSDYKAIKEAFVKKGNIFSGKPKLNVFKFSSKDKGLLMAEGEIASQHRRFILSSFRDFGMGKTNLEPQLMVEIKYFMDEIRKENGHAIDLQPLLRTSVSNILSMLEFGKRFEYSDEEFIHLRKLVTHNSKFCGSLAIRVFLPWIKYIPFTDKFIGFHKTKEGVKEVTNFFCQKVQHHENNYTEGSRTHLIDAYITERNSIIEKTGSEGCFSKDELIGNLRALFGAGTETTTGLLLWSIIYILKYPEIRKKIYQEINDVIGHSRDPAFADKTNMPYTSAYLLEVHRHASIVPFSLVHSNMEETNVLGFTIPKYSYIIGNLWAVHHDKNLWENPDEFNPDRFLNEQGEVQKSEYLIPFSIGKRNCIGESLANTQNFLYFTTLLQNFEIRLPKGETVSMEFQFGVALTPKPFKICMINKLEQYFKQ